MWIQAADFCFYHMPYFTTKTGSVSFTNVSEVISYYGTAGPSALRAVLREIGIKAVLIGDIRDERNLHVDRGLIDCRVSEFTLKDVIPVPSEADKVVAIPNWDSPMIGFRTWHPLNDITNYLNDVDDSKIINRVLLGSPFLENRGLVKRRLRLALKRGVVNGNVLLEWKNEVRSAVEDRVHVDS